MYCSVNAELLLSLFEWLESTPLGIWVRESAWGFPSMLIVHVWSMAFVSGISLLVVLSVFGVAPRVLPALLDKYLPLTWTAISVSFASGVVLICTYPDKVFSNVLFYVKMVFIATALTLAVSLQRKCALLDAANGVLYPVALKAQAAGILLLWFGAIVTGRLLYYTYGP
jgi:hypothetical protein